MTLRDDRSGAAPGVPAPVRPGGAAATYRTVVEAVLSGAVLPVSVTLAFVVAARFGTVAALVVALLPALGFVGWIVRTRRRAAFYGLLGLCCAVVATAVIGAGIALWETTRPRPALRVVVATPPGVTRAVFVRAGTSQVLVAPPPAPDVPDCPPDVPTPR